MKLPLSRAIWNVPSILLGCIITLFILGWINFITYSENFSKYMRGELSRQYSVNYNGSLKMPLHFHEHNNEVEMENRSEADYLQQKVRVLCWVMTMPENHVTKAIHVNNTWGKRCNKLVFMSTAENIRTKLQAVTCQCPKLIAIKFSGREDIHIVYDPKLPTVNLGFKESRDILWGKTKKGFKYVYDHYLNDYDWFMKADDDTYVIVENVRYLLSTYDADQDAMYFGSRFKKFTKQGYMSGGGGYILSRKSLKLFVEKALTNQSLCKQDDSGSEDVEMGKCLYNVGVMAGDSRDNHAHGRFFPFEPNMHLVPGEIDPKMWYWDYIYYPIKNGPECCSDLAVSFHYVPPKKMYELEYLIYHLHPFGVHHLDPFPQPLPPDKESVPERILKPNTSQMEKVNTTINSSVNR